MKSEKVEVSYRDKSTNTNVSLGEIELDLPETVEEAVEKFGPEKLIDYATRAYIIEQQGVYRDANRPDRPKQQTTLAKFKQLSVDKQEELLRQAGLL